MSVGSLFSCDEEDGEMFSNSYLTDLKDGRCDVTGRIAKYNNYVNNMDNFFKLLNRD